MVTCQSVTGKEGILLGAAYYQAGNEVAYFQFREPKSFFGLFCRGGGGFGTTGLTGGFGSSRGLLA